MFIKHFLLAGEKSSWRTDQQQVKLKHYIAEGLSPLSADCFSITLQQKELFLHSVSKSHTFTKEAGKKILQIYTVIHKK